MRKRIALGALVSLLVFGLAIGASAATATQTIEVNYRDIAVQVNGQPVASDVEPFIYQDRTFVPIRFVAQSLGKMVTWDQEKAQVRIAEPLTLDESFNGKTIYLSKESQVFSIILAGNPTTGYAWMATDYDKTLLELVGEPTLYITSQTGTVPMAGQGGIFNFRFLTKGQVGETTVKLGYARNWESKPPEQTFELNVRINLTDSVMTLTDTDNGGAATLVMPVQKLDLLLKGNPTTGYAWEIVGADGQILALQGEPTFKADSDALGSPGVYTYHFAPQNPGVTTIMLNYSKQGEGKPTQTYQFLVGVF
jgi:predicted secreted protein